MRQWNDVVGVIRVKGAALDRDHLEHAARELGVGDLLVRALRDAGAGA